MSNPGKEYKSRNPSYTNAILEGRQEAIEHNRRNPNIAMIRAAAGGSGIGCAFGAFGGFVGGWALGGIKKAAVLTPRTAAAAGLLMGVFSAFDCNRSRIKREAEALEA